MPLNPNASERLLYPTMWGKRFDPNDTSLEHFHKYWKEESEKQAKYLKKPNIRYATGDRARLDIYFKDKENGTPIIAFFHGGYWQEFDKETAAYWLKPFVEKGYRVIMIGYDLCPNISLQDLIEQSKSAVKFILQYAAETNTKTISLMGHSAGAHLAISLFDKDILQEPGIDLIKSMFLVAGIYDLRPLLGSTVNSNNLLTLDESNVQKLSPSFLNYDHLKGRSLKIYVCAAEDDSPMFVEQAEAFDKHLKGFHVDSEYKFVKDHDHMDIMEDVAKEEFELTKMLMKELKK